MTTRPLAKRTNEEIAKLVAELRSAAGCPTKRLSRGGHEFVVAKHTPDTATEFEKTRELLWIAGATRVTARHIEKLQASAGGVDANRATIVTIGSGKVEPSLEETINHLSEEDLRTSLRQTDGLSVPSELANSETATGSSDLNGVSTVGSKTGEETRDKRSVATTESDQGQSEQSHTRSGSAVTISRSPFERISGPLVIADMWNGTTTARQDAVTRSVHWQQTTHATSSESTGSMVWGSFDGSTTEDHDRDGE